MVNFLISYYFTVSMSLIFVLMHVSFYLINMFLVLFLLLFCFIVSLQFSLIKSNLAFDWFNSLFLWHLFFVIFM